MKLTREEMTDLLKQTDKNISKIKQGILKGDVRLSREDKAVMDMLYRQISELQALSRLVVEAQDGSR